MSITIYQQSRAFVSLSRFHLARFLIGSGGCVAAYTFGKRMCRSKSERVRSYGHISVHYAKFCGTLIWGHMAVLTCGALVYARIKNLPRAVLLQRGFVYGEKLGFSSACMYLFTKELSSREWFAQVSAGAYSGLQWSLIQGMKGWPAYHSTRIGIYCGAAVFLLYEFCQCCIELWAVFSDPNLTYSAWDEFSVGDYFWRKTCRFFNYDSCVRYFEWKNIEEAIILARNEMNELEALAIQAGVTKSDLKHVNVNEINDYMFDMFDKVQTGRLEFDDISVTTSTLKDMQWRHASAHYVDPGTDRPTEFTVYQQGESRSRNPRESGANMIVEEGGISPQWRREDWQPPKAQLPWDKTNTARDVN